MGGNSTFGVFTLARMGVYAASQGLHVTGNNITNINTEGYTRQKLEQYSLHMIAADRYSATETLRLGAGVYAPDVSQTRDQYLDIRYRNVTTDVGYMSAQAEGMDHLANVLDEVTKGEDEGGIIEAMFNEVVQRIEELSAEGAGQDQADSLFRASVDTLVRQINYTAAELDKIHVNREEQLQQDIDHVNDILVQIRDLNTKIRKNTIYGDNSLEMKDTRNLLLDELSEYMSINVTYRTEAVTDSLDGQKDDTLMIRTGTEPQRVLLDGLYATELSIRHGTDTGDDPNYDINLDELRDIHGNSRVLKENDLGVVKNRDIGAIMNENGDIGGPDDPILTFAGKEEAQALADTLNETAVGTEFLVQYGDGSYSIHEYGTTIYETSEDATTALQLLKESPELSERYPETSDVVNEVSGEVTRYQLKVLSTEDGGYEIHQMEVFRGKVETKDTELNGRLLADRELLTEKGVFATAEDLANDQDAANKRGIPFYRKALDVLANSLATALNEANQIPEEDLYQMADIQSTDENGNIVTTREFVDEDGNVVTGDKDSYVLRPEYSYYNGGVLISNSSTGNDDYAIDALNISVSQNWTNGSFRVLHTKIPLELDEQGNPVPTTTANDNLNRIRHILTDAHEFVPFIEDVYEKADSDDVFFTGSYQQLFTDHMSLTLAVDYNYVSTMLNNTSVAADNLYVDRDGVMGVDLNDEAMSIMMYQKAYDAACRLMTTFDEMIDRLINGTAV